MDGSFSATGLKNGLELYLSRGALHEAGLSFSLRWASGSRLAGVHEGRERGEEEGVSRNESDSVA